MLSSMFDSELIEPERIRPLSRKEYERMVEVGILDEDERIELLRGAIVQMSPQKWHHATVTAWFTEHLVRQLDTSYEVRPQLPFAADDWSEPEPDLAVARKDYTRRDHPTEVFLIIEVAESSLRKDRLLKLGIYAEAGVPEYWIVDLKSMTIHVCTQPRGGAYGSVVTLRDGDVLRPTLLPALSFAVADIPR
jgi:Uma2 family endonuclease